jgi:hypothetical protein
MRTHAASPRDAKETYLMIIKKKLGNWLPAAADELAKTFPFFLHGKHPAVGGGGQVPKFMVRRPIGKNAGSTLCVDLREGP